MLDAYRRNTKVDARLNLSIAASDLGGPFDLTVVQPENYDAPICVGEPDQRIGEIFEGRCATTY